MALPTPRSAMLTLLRAYKFAISPLFPPSCRYVPTCSEYAMEAVERHGALRGSMLGFWRLLRCHPFVKGGFDPVPLNCHAADSVAAGHLQTLGGGPGGAPPHGSTQAHTH